MILRSERNRYKQNKIELLLLTISIRPNDLPQIVHICKQSIATIEDDFDSKQEFRFLIKKRMIEFLHFDSYL